MGSGESAAFDEYVGIDYSGAGDPMRGLAELRVYVATGTSDPVEVAPPDGRSKYWSRRGIAEWLEERLKGPNRTLVGIDHGFSFPRAYFERHGLAWDWPAFLVFQNGCNPRRTGCYRACLGRTRRWQRLPSGVGILASHGCRKRETREHLYSPNDELG